MNINEVFKLIREKEKLTQEKMGNLLEISPNHISNIENNRKMPSVELLKKILEKFNLNKECLKEVNSLINKKSSKKKGQLVLKKREEELNKREKLVNDTYSFLRESSLVMSKVASIQLKLIEINNFLDKELNEIEFSILGDDHDKEVLKKLNRPFKTTVKRLENKIEKIKQLSNLSFDIEIETEKGGKMSEFDYLSQYVAPISVLSKEHKEIAVQTYIAKNLRYRWKDYIIDDEHPTPYSNRLWGGGRGTLGKKGFMSNKVKEDIGLQVLSASDTEELEEIFREVGWNLIERSVTVAEMLLKDARNAKTQSVRDKYNKAMHDDEFLFNLLKICVHLYASGLVDEGQKLPSLTLHTKIEASKQHKTKIDKLWKNVSKGIITFEEALNETESITSYYEKTILSEKELDRVGYERMILQITGEKNVKGYMVEIMNIMVRKFKALVE
jgi:transcriptional regulator with XRE-family HTH domain